MVKILWHVVVKLLEIQWSNQTKRETIWELEKEIKEKYPYFFHIPGTSSLED